MHIIDGHIDVSLDLNYILPLRVIGQRVRNLGH